MSKYPLALQQLIASLKMLPGVGSKTAERFAFQLLTWQDEPLENFADVIATLKTKIHTCPACHCLMEKEVCEFCDINKRDSSLLCIISSPKDAYAIEETHMYKGLYHVLGGLLSTLEGDATALYLKEQLGKSEIPVSRLALGLPMGSPLEYVDGGTLSRALTG